MREKYSEEQILRIIENHSIYLYGAGHMCEEFLKYFKYPDDIVCVVDDYSKKVTLKEWNESIGREIVLTVNNNITEAIYGHQKPVWIIITSSQYGPINANIRKQGIDNVSFAWDFCACLDAEFSKAVIPGEKLIGHESETLQVCDLLSDDKSKEVYIEVLRRRRNGEADYSDVMSSDEQYFETGIMPISDTECIVDAGAFVGDTVLAFKRNFGGWKKVYCFEPDKGNYIRLQNNVKDLKDCTCICAGVGKASGEMRFCSLGGDNSRVDDFGEDIIMIKAIDNLQDSSISLIKMDIEGCEIEALKGAEKTIRQNTPKLAISIYHKPDDLWEIPLLISSWNAGYNFYIRHYSVMASETILYAIPK